MSPQKETLSITGMQCAACAARIEKVVRRQAGVIDAHVNLATERATVTFAPEDIGLSDIIARIEKLGYGATTSQSNDASMAAERFASLQMFLFSLLLSMSVLQNSIFHRFSHIYSVRTINGTLYIVSNAL
ncbi:cation transporter [Alicyclobacillus acidoterrestris]|uniref:cation transporter n=1 Tax=Alicyclobacillus acidoterrestris TaxID=1450 RepID=UPI003F538CF4